MQRGQIRYVIPMVQLLTRGVIAEARTTSPHRVHRERNFSRV